MRLYLVEGGDKKDMVGHVLFNLGGTLLKPKFFKFEKNFPKGLNGKICNMPKPVKETAMYVTKNRKELDFLVVLDVGEELVLRQIDMEQDPDQKPERKKTDVAKREKMRMRKRTEVNYAEEQEETVDPTSEKPNY